ncbi:glycine zipper family protein [Limimaricola litoreus]|uniref:Glycine zipper family protein n=1 Tax=Limimaricola litoreus TaxID=2955316 RepID=A0A9X2FQ11_9RHOB|nr:glycine zipper family protein [Limimaricola litoreus]MCP1167694.1 glycine zipper family protein [Limimaricola litoreus]
MKPMLIAPICMTALLAACADMSADVDPILDGAPRAQFQSDLAACRHLARSQSQLDHDTMAAAVIGAGIGGVLGKVDEEGDALGGAVVGALAGAAASASEASDTREDIVLNCLRGRGHAVVN